ncbi:MULTISPECIES: TetR/AcrR family transcriptional regulator [unclassified Curtobacterium]|uniref:TetR/AcrR family transcriptional regulator n=1 Tax=unclassified Curtobacterium TaxID=257496 RepID=UPI000F47FE4B|nr:MULTISPECIES: TetR/AcrR family transcriptional regulator [unclassified Curtobacterium]ROQ03951.1 TetR family transcriptional regulator [Curtobacterium sp. PhB171]ROQ19002.1 TetR family transcriptional regulator [Curtobacterium sp. PhB170]ROS32591.1 TetR family transcriptional regulator [Curtobacterium sp. PhB131]ROS63641.1 TetR family transcriptional regulator [Curtobacterium sp. PhB141]
MTSNDGIGTRGPYAKGVQRRREILDQTLDVVASRGIDGTSLRAIGDAIGVSHAALKHYFSSREALLVEVLRERDAASDRALGDTAGVFTRLAVVADRNVSEPALVTLYTTLLGASVESGNETAREFFAARFDEARGNLVAQLHDELAASGRHSDADLEQVASLIIAAFDGLQVQWLLDRNVDIAGTLRLLERVL